jgi:hypothetical protein
MIDTNSLSDIASNVSGISFLSDITYNIGGIANVITLITGIPALAAMAKNFFEPNRVLPEPIFFIRTYSDRRKLIGNKKNYEISAFFFVLFALIALAAYIETTVEDVNVYLGVISLLFFISGVFFTISFIFWITYSLKESANRAPRMGAYRALLNWGRIFSYSFGITFSLISFVGISLKLSEAQKVSDIVVPSVLLTIVDVFGVVALYYSCSNADNKDSDVAMAYVTDNVENKYIHFKEDGKYVCTDKPFFTGCKDYELVNENEFDEKKIRVIRDVVHSQIVDIDKIQTRISDNKTTVDEAIKTVLLKGNYEKLSAEEIAKINDFCKREFPSVFDSILRFLGKILKAVVKFFKAIFFIIKVILGVIIWIFILIRRGYFWLKKNGKRKVEESQNRKNNDDNDDDGTIPQGN